MTKQKIIEDITNALLYASLGGLGGFIAYINGIRKGKKFSFIMFVINIIIAGYVGWLVYDLIGESLGSMKGSIISISGVICYNIIDFIEDKGFTLILKKYVGNLDNK